MLYVLEPVPNLDGNVDWTAERDARPRRARRRPSPARATRSRPTSRHFVDPLDWEAQGMERGTPFSLAHTFFQTGPFRPPNVERRAPGLVFTGSATVPGVGVPMVLCRACSPRNESTRWRRRDERPGRHGPTRAVTLEESYARCRALNKRYGTTYYWSTLALPRVKRHHVYALYAFCRYADDIVDDLADVATDDARAKRSRELR